MLMQEIEEEALRHIRSARQGVLQSELWKELGVDSRKCSRIVKKLLDAGLIERMEYRGDGSKTYQLIAKKQATDYSVILAGGEILPCICCDLECTPEECTLLMDWMYHLALEGLEE